MQMREIMSWHQTGISLSQLISACLSSYLSAFDLTASILAVWLYQLVYFTNHFTSSLKGLTWTATIPRLGLSSAFFGHIACETCHKQQSQQPNCYPLCTPGTLHVTSSSSNANGFPNQWWSWKILKILGICSTAACAFQLGLHLETWICEAQRLYLNPLRHLFLGKACGIERWRICKVQDH